MYTRLTEDLPTNWVDFIEDDGHRGVVPVGRRFQADLPDLILDYKEENKKKYESESSKWLGTKVWEPKLITPIDEEDEGVGKGRPTRCPCELSGNVECVKMHITIKRIKLKFELGFAFLAWHFDKMGEEVSKLWALEEQKKFESIVKMNYCPPKGTGFLKPALESFPSRSLKSIVSYYFNVYLLRRISKESRMRCKIIDTDKEEEEEEEEEDEVGSKSSRKKCKVSVAKSHGDRVGKTRFLGRRR